MKKSIVSFFVSQNREKISALPVLREVLAPLAAVLPSVTRIATPIREVLPVKVEKISRDRDVLAKISMIIRVMLLMEREARTREVLAPMVPVLLMEIEREAKEEVPTAEREAMAIETISVLSIVSRSAKEKAVPDTAVIKTKSKPFLLITA